MVIKHLMGLVVGLLALVGVARADNTVYSYQDGGVVTTEICEKGIYVSDCDNGRIDFAPYDKESECEDRVAQERKLRESSGGVTTPPSGAGNGISLTYTYSAQSLVGGYFSQARLDDVLAALAKVKGEHEKAVKIHASVKDAVEKAHEDFCRTHECGGF